ncbi:hypothetical protein ATO6_09255 [Oceanicola sp. 22II-s10i]|nr:hypothetical protein ATO6_09255 [Oceanicola sp. 22II-s10i]
MLWSISGGALPENGGLPEGGEIVGIASHDLERGGAGIYASGRDFYLADGVICFSAGTWNTASREPQARARMPGLKALPGVQTATRRNRPCGRRMRGHRFRDGPAGRQGALV